MKSMKTMKGGIVEAAEVVGADTRIARGFG